jgi:DNA-binding response OmpR family regulator
MRGERKEERGEKREELSKSSLLIVDDNPDIRTYLRTILENRYEVTEAADGKSGLEVASASVPDLIISDVMMPVMNGLEFCQQVKQHVATSHIPVILLTARALSHHQVEGYESGADAYLTKPFSPEVLLARVENLLKSREKLKELFNTPEQHASPEEQSQKEEHPVESSVNSRDRQFVERLRQIIQEKMTDSNLSVEDVGAEIGLSRVQLYRKVKALTGSTPVDLIRKARLAKARELLQTTGKSVSEVAYDVGFSAPSYFTKCFKEEYGMLPGDLQ